MENEQRADLNDLERAAGYRELLALTGDTQAALAQRLGKSQPYVANLLRLLELPFGWQQRLISGEITQTQARSLLPYASRPQLLARLERDIIRAAKDDALPLPRDDFERTLWGSVKDATRSLEYGRSEYPDSRSVQTQFRVTDKHRAALDCIEVPSPWNAREKFTRACNVALWNELNAAAAQRKKERAAADEDRPQKGAGKNRAKAPSAAARHAQDAQRAALHHRRIEYLRIDWLAWLVAQRLQPGNPAVPARLLWTLLLALAQDEPAVDHHQPQSYEGSVMFDRRVEERRERLVALLQEQGPPLRRIGGGYGGDRGPGRQLFDGLLDALPDDAACVRFAQRFVRACLWDETEKTPVGLLAPRQVERLARELHVDLAAAWRAERLGPLMPRFWDAHDRQQLCDLGKAWGIHCTPDEPKKTLVSRLSAAPASVPLPALLDFPAVRQKKPSKKKPKPR